MTLRPAVTQVLTQAIAQVARDLTDQLQATAREQAVPSDEVDSLVVAFVDGDFVASSSSEDYLEREYGRPPVPALGLLRRYNNQLPALSAELLDQHAGRLLESRGVL